MGTRGQYITLYLDVDWKAIQRQISRNRKDNSAIKTQFPETDVGNTVWQGCKTASKHIAISDDIIAPMQSINYTSLFFALFLLKQAGDRKRGIPG